MQGAAKLEEINIINIAKKLVIFIGAIDQLINKKCFSTCQVT